MEERSISIEEALHAIGVSIIEIESAGHPSDTLWEAYDTLEYILVNGALR